jgi:hypothetical protein
MAKLARGHIDVDTRPHPNVPASYYRVASDTMFEIVTRGSSDLEATSGADSRVESLSISIQAATSPTSETRSQQTQPSIPVPSISPTMSGTAAPPPPPEFSIGVIFAIAVGGIIGLAIPTILLTRYFQRAKQRRKQMEEEDAVLEHMMSHNKVDQRAWNMGFKRLNKASMRKWSDNEATAQLADVLGQANLDTKPLWSRGRAEREMLRKLFEHEDKVRRGDKEKGLPMLSKVEGNGTITAENERRAHSAAFVQHVRVESERK